MRHSRSSNTARRIARQLGDGSLFAFVTVATIIASSGCGGRETSDGGPGVNGSRNGNGTAMTGGNAATGGATTSGGNATTGGGGGGTGGGNATGGAGGRDPVICPATCALGAGAFFYFATAAEIDKAVAGRWRICAEGAKIFAATKPADAIAVEFSSQEVTDSMATGKVRYLVEGSGGVTPGAGSAYETTYRIWFHEGVGNFFVNDYTGYFVRYSPCPEQLEFAVGAQGRTVIAGMD